MQDYLPTTENAQNPPETAGASDCQEAAFSSAEEEVLFYADYTYLQRRKAVLEASEDEMKFRRAFKDFQKSAWNLSSQARAIHRYCQDTDQRIAAIDILDRVRMDLLSAIRLAQHFEEAHIDADEYEKSCPVANLKIEGIAIFRRISITIEKIKSGKDAELAIQTAHAKMMEEVSPMVKHVFEATRERSYSPILLYPIPLPPKGEPIPQFPEAFVRFVLLPPEDMDRYPNGAFKIPEGYRDENGEDLTHLWDVDWEQNGLAVSGVTEEESLNGKRQWYTFVQDDYTKKIPPECVEFYKRMYDPENLKKPPNTA